MTMALESACEFVEGCPADKWEHFQFDARYMREAVRQVRELQAELVASRVAVASLRSAIAAREICERMIVADRNGWKYAYEQLRDAPAPTMRASGGVMVVVEDGSVSIRADNVVMTGTLVA